MCTDSLERRVADYAAKAVTNSLTTQSHLRGPVSRKPQKLDFEAAEWVGIHGLSFLASDAGRLGRFLSLTGLGPSDIARAKGDPGFLASVLEYLLGDEPLLLEFAANNSLPPERVQTAWDILTLESARRSRA